MKTNNELNNKDLDNVSGGNSSLEKYLKDLVGKDKSKIIIDNGEGKQLDLNPSIDYEKDEKLIIIKREKDPQE